MRIWRNKSFKSPSRALQKLRQHSSRFAGNYSWDFKAQQPNLYFFQKFLFRVLIWAISLSFQALGYNIDADDYHRFVNSIRVMWIDFHKLVNALTFVNLI